MRSGRISAVLTAALLLTGLTVGWRAAPPPAHAVALPSEIPSIVASHAAKPAGRVAATTSMSITVTLPLRNQGRLNRMLTAMATPGSRLHGHYLTQGRANRLFAPTADSVATVESWLRAGGMRVGRVAGNRLAVDATGTEGTLSRLLSTRLGWYREPDGGKRFFAPQSDPILPASVSSSVLGIVGLDSIPAHLAAVPPNGTRSSHPPYYPQDLADAYDVNALWSAGYDGTGQHIGITLWIPPPRDTTLTKWATYTGADVATRANGRLVVHAVDGINHTRDTEEAGMDVEYSGGMAPGATIDFWLAATPFNNTLYDALNQAGTNSGASMDSVISSSWGECEGSRASQQSMEQMFAMNSATGHNYFFASGDTASYCATGHKKKDRIRPEYPASSRYVTAVGGTAFNGSTNGTGTIPGTWPGESAWHYNRTGNSGGWCDTRYCPEGSGGGFSKLYARPVWQPRYKTQPNRGYPDVSALADPQWGVYACEDASCPSPGQAFAWGGTSLATPLWAGITADVDQMLQAQTATDTVVAATGFINPTLYGMAAATQEFAPFHDITSGQNGGYRTGPGWDPVTGLGSPDAYNLARDWLGLSIPDWQLASNTDLSGNTTITWETLRPETGYNVFDGSTQVNPVGQPVTSATADYTYETTHVFVNPPTVAPAQ